MVDDHGGSEGQAEHVHVELVLFDTRRVIARTVEKLRSLRLIGVVERADHPADTLGRVRATVLTAGDSVLTAGPEGIAPGRSIEETAELLRRQLAAGVLAHDCAGNQRAATVPANIADRMQGAGAEQQEIRRVYVLPTSFSAEKADIEFLAFCVGGAITHVQVGGRDVLVGFPRRPSTWPKSQRPVVQLIAMSDHVEVAVYSTSAVQWWRGPLKAARQQAVVSLLSVWNAPPVRLVEDSAGDGPYPAMVRGQAIALERLGQAVPSVPEDFPAAAGRSLSELGLDREAIDEFVALAASEWSAELLPRLVRLLRLPEEVASLATGELTADSLPGAVAADSTGALAQLTERRYRR
ncbi:hypothetical protein GCG21_15970 [Pseudactinotalea sp. HY160]|uniref:hypothetical protein n=1 Tax=Pseudactinotalea sp. HY160 TaxID=2654490 RepID=UPI00128E1D68|nr:hypothetical protein [Pseudactinotalea sp. HY160]MPV51476.1 hypothetical protein [Pseudactinotalea sp. HY160]